MGESEKPMHLRKTWSEAAHFKPSVPAWFFSSLIGSRIHPKPSMDSRSPVFGIFRYSIFFPTRF